MAHTMYLKISGIPGDCARPDHKDWIEILNFSQAVARPERGGGRTQLMDFSISKYSDRSSPLLALACFEGWRIQEVTVETCGPDGGKLMEIRLADAEISNFNVSGGGDPEHPAYDSLCIRYGKLEWLYFPKGATEPVKSAWADEEVHGPATPLAARQNGRRA